ncbi:hypothetical protein AVEN_74606-1 [Araneus ventricosus]|uniref:Integrase zinc-binding domain-containing protein n=1 Tax=Araneus ventricosus TaxID=182803 RepID=A0A4Y2X005_ARAVE|nr:hypothetical protein AVEN_6268-1 [Araneus ventricosus]GBO42258.1 hypothetical protein AVEN_25549-1 [Araneus ventricosus]GBO42261.1 hypothetical protein AVEN_72352-1 [Araneus ventricosus]GBO42264.1 hypothetical protein AVEN_74606-1 [Araneus ventricosus]
MLHLCLHHLGVRITLSELQSEFWIIRGRQEFKKILRECLPCKVFKQKKSQLIEALLPADRVNATKPFHVTGIDLAGPLYARKYQSVGKAYIALFTSVITKALHLELISDLSYLTSISYVTLEEVLLQEERRPRQVWERALALKLIPDIDGIQRTYRLKCDGKTIARPIQLVIPLEIDHGWENVEE